MRAVLQCNFSSCTSNDRDIEVRKSPNLIPLDTLSRSCLLSYRVTWSTHVFSQYQKPHLHTPTIYTACTCFKTMKQLGKERFSWKSKWFLNCKLFQWHLLQISWAAKHFSEQVSVWDHVNMYAHTFSVLLRVITCEIWMRKLFSTAVTLETSFSPRIQAKS